MQNQARINPFHTLYVTEGLEADAFIHLFSPIILDHALALFQPGNVLIRGLKGSGKSMLLHLLLPETRIAYAEQQRAFPVPAELANFVGAGINLTWSGIVDFGQRSFAHDPEENKAVLPLYFGDYLNYWLVGDLIDSVRKLADSNVGRNMGISAVDAQWQTFYDSLATDNCWFGAFDNRKSNTVRAWIDKRIVDYRQFLQFNLRAVPNEISETKSRIGVPVSICAEKLKEVGIVPKATNFFLRIDQYEELHKLEEAKGTRGAFREVIHKALGARDPNISYRIGSRPYAWQPDMRVHGTSSELESDRNFSIVDLDLVLKRHENRRSYIFPAFAEDIFRRRLIYSGLLEKQSKVKLTDVFGETESADERARRYTRSSSRGVIKVDPAWPEDWRRYLMSRAEDHPLSAKLGEAWLRQQLASRVPKPLPDPATEPWETKEKGYWKKERVQHALLQIAMSRAQRIFWAGASDILALSGGNVLVFVSLCQHVWAVWLRTRRNEPVELLLIDEDIQSIGIQECSLDWFNKIPEEPRGGDRQRFIQYLGKRFQKQLAEDLTMSYPGRNGFSTSEDAVADFPDVKNFLNECVNYGDLTTTLHTTKEKNRKQRRKWYLSQVLSPFFRIPVNHVKEPWYLEFGELALWMNDAGVLQYSGSHQIQASKASSKPQSKAQLQIF